MVQRQNTVFILSDEHNRKIAGCYGHPFIKTPNIDALAARGTRFDAAYCNSPICVPSRAALATGQYVHKNHCWDNALPYHGQIQSWHHVIREAGREVVSIGKLHFRSQDDDNGFSQEILPMHILGGKGDLKGLLRKNPAPKIGADDLARTAGRGVSDYFRFDREIADEAVAWIAGHRGPAAPPWALFVSFVMPHFPLIAPEEYYSLYEQYPLETLRFRLDSPAPDHPVLSELNRDFAYSRHFDDQKRCEALRAYFGMVTALDDNIGTIIAALRDHGLEENTRVNYASDHGDNLGNRDMWGKCVHYEDSVAIPAIAVGNGFPIGTNQTPISLVDLFPTMVESTGVADPANFEDIDGKSLFDIANHPDEQRIAFSEYHAVFSRAAHFMIRKGKWKLCHYLDGPPQLFNLVEDPDEKTDLAARPEFSATLDELQTALRSIVDPEAANTQAFKDQEAVIAKSGGVEAILESEDIPYTPIPT